MNLDLNSEKGRQNSNMNKSFDESFLSGSLPYSSKNFCHSRSRKSWCISKSNEESEFLSLNKGKNTFCSMKDFSVPQLKADIKAWTLNKEINSLNSSTDFCEFSLFEDIGDPNLRINVPQLNTDIGIRTLNKKTDSSNSSIASSGFNSIDDIGVSNSSMHLVF